MLICYYVADLLLVANQHDESAVVNYWVLQNLSNKNVMKLLLFWLLLLPNKEGSWVFKVNSVAKILQNPVFTIE